MPNYYRILEVQPGAPLKDIKRSYRKLVRLYHPDSSGTKLLEDRFHQIQEAYEVLSDPAKRARYDQENDFVDWTKEKVETYRRNQAQAERFSRSSRSYFRDGDTIRENTGTTGRGERPRSGQKSSDQGQRTFQKKTSEKSRTDQDESSVLEAMSTFLEKAKNIARNTIRRSKKSKASGATAKKRVFRGRVRHRVVIDAMESLTGTQREITVAGRSTSRKIRVRIPAGVSPGAVLKLDCPTTSTHKAQVVRINVSVTPHPLVERNGLDVIVKIPISVGEALSGVELQVPTLEGSVKVTIPPCWDASKRIRLRGRGVKDPLGSGQGNLFVQTHIVLPEKIDESATEAAKFIDRFYNQSVRHNIPKSLLTKK